MTETPASTSSPQDPTPTPPPSAPTAAPVEPQTPEATDDDTTTDDSAADGTIAPADAVTPDETAHAADEAPAADVAAAETSADTETAPADESGPADEVAPTDSAAPTDATPDEAAPADETPTDDAASEAGDEPTTQAGDEPASEAGDEPTSEAPAVPTPRPTPASARPGPRPRPIPHPPTAAAAAAPTPAAAPVPAPDDSAEAAHAATFGSVDADGTVSVREAAGERVVGQFPGASSEEALALYVRRFLDLQAKVTLFEARLQATDLSVKEIDQTLTRLTEELKEPAAVGDLDALRERLESLRSVAAERRAAAEAERQAARQVALEARTAIVEQAEKIAATDPARIQWRPAGEQLRTLLEEWKTAQRSGPRLDRPTEESLWKRFSHARTTFDRERRHFFAELEARNAGAKAAKEELVAEAERLQDSSDWGPTAGAFRDLMTRWKAAGRASRADDDALWARFRAAQDAFFAARDAHSAATDTEFRANLEVKEALLTEAEALLPVRDLNAAKQAIRSIQDRWEAAGKVPRADIQRVEGRLRAVESAIRDAEQAQWRRTNPETRARAEGAAAQLEQAIAGLEADLEHAKSAGDARRIADAQAALDARRSWLEQVQRAAEDARG